MIEAPTAVTEALTALIEALTALIAIGRDQDHDPVTVASTPDAVAQENIVAEILVREDLILVTAIETERIATEEIVDFVVMTMV